MQSIVTAVEASTPVVNTQMTTNSQPWYNEQAARTKERIEVVLVAKRRTKCN